MTIQQTRSRLTRKPLLGLLVTAAAIGLGSNLSGCAHQDVATPRGEFISNCRDNPRAFGYIASKETIMRMRFSGLEFTPNLSQYCMRLAKRTIGRSVAFAEP
ncbi:MAG: hypothetical protein AAGI88_18755 [Pseudomonadota bacterium]